jgi:hypothetical protein
MDDYFRQLEHIYISITRGIIFMVAVLVIVDPSRPLHTSVYTVCASIGLELCVPEMSGVHGPSPLLPETVQETVFWLVQVILLIVSGATRLGPAMILAIGGGTGTQAPLSQTNPAPQLVTLPVH